MSKSFQIAEELKRWGPHAPSNASCSLAFAREYCRNLAKSHYENFHVASWLLPRNLRPHFYSVYAYCRWSDDLADEISSPADAEQLLAWWEKQLERCYAGEVNHPVFVALAETIREFSIPVTPFRNLLIAFRQDQHQTRYETWDELDDYCRCSANPVGHVVLYLGRCFNEQTAALSDSICTGLQLANFLQDVSGDLERGRIYVPQQLWRENGYTESMFQTRQYNIAFRQMMASAVERARHLFQHGEPLINLVPRALKIDVALFVQGGCSILDAIAQQQYDVWSRRPVVRRKHLLLLRALWRSWFGS